MESSNSVRPVVRLAAGLLGLAIVTVGLLAVGLLAVGLWTDGIRALRPWRATAALPAAPLAAVVYGRLFLHAAWTGENPPFGDEDDDVGGEPSAWPSA